MNKYLRKTKISIILQAAFFILLIAADRITKVCAHDFLKDKPDKILIRNVISLQYVENTGAAFGIFKNSQWIFIALSIIILIAVIIYFVTVNKRLITYCSASDYGEGAESRFNVKVYRTSVFTGYILAGLGAGAIGNFIDRIFCGYVTDFLKFEFISFPVFNLADVYITVSVVLLLIQILFTKDDNRLKLSAKDDAK